MLAGMNLSKPGINLSKPGMNLSKPGKKHRNHVIIFNKLVRYILLSVFPRLSELPQLSFVQYLVRCAFGLPISRMVIMRISVLYLIIIIKSDV